MKITINNFTRLPEHIIWTVHYVGQESCSTQSEGSEGGPTFTNAAAGNTGKTYQNVKQVSRIQEALDNCWLAKNIWQTVSVEKNLVAPSVVHIYLDAVQWTLPWLQKHLFTYSDNWHTCPELTNTRRASQWHMTVTHASVTWPELSGHLVKGRHVLRLSPCLDQLSSTPICQRPLS